MSTVNVHLETPEQAFCSAREMRTQLLSSGTFTCSPLIPHGPILRRIIIIIAITFEHSIPGEAN